MKIIPPRLHGILDYVTVLLFLGAPALLGLAGWPRAIAYALAGVHLAMTLATDFPAGAVKLLPFPVHGWVERVVGPVLIVLPFVLGFRASARVFYLAMGAVVVVVGLLSQYRADASRPA